VSRHPLLLLSGVVAVAVVVAVLRLPGGSSTKRTPSPYLERDGTHLVLRGERYTPVGLNAYELATEWGSNSGCGAMLDDTSLNHFFAGLPRGGMVRVWGFQGSMAINPSTGAREWGPLDRVISAAGRHGQLLVISLTDQAGTCDDGHWKDAAWYLGGYRAAPQGSVSTPYWDWLHEIVRRYRTSRTVAMWEPVNEPEAAGCAPTVSAGACGSAPRCRAGAAGDALRSFFDTVGAEIRRIDPNHLVESGSLGGPQCGWTATKGRRIAASPGIDVTSYHDYESTEALPRDLRARLREATRIRKPLLVGELGIRAGASVAGCSSSGRRAAVVRSKVDAMLAAGAAGVLVWDWVPVPQDRCDYDVGPGDPLLGLLRGARG
jgi:mannan endo-1,4-beta-mannosidase